LATLLKVLFALNFTWLAFGLAGCSQYEEGFSFIRDPIIRARIEGQPFTARRFETLELGQVVFNPPEGGPTVIFQRIMLKAYPTNNDLERLEIILDVADFNNMVGLFSFDAYQLPGKVHQVKFIRRQPGNNQNFESFQLQLLSPPIPNFFEVRRQSRNDTLILGDFEFSLEGIQDPAITLVLENGEFRDLSYRQSRR
jgi:hypothetical protein